MEKKHIWKDRWWPYYRPSPAGLYFHPSPGYINGILVNRAWGQQQDQAGQGRKAGCPRTFSGQNASFSCPASPRGSVVVVDFWFWFYEKKLKYYCREFDWKPNSSLVGENHVRPLWMSVDSEPVAYVQQIIVKAMVHPYRKEELIKTGMNYRY